MIFLAIFFILSGVYLVLLIGRLSHRELPALKNWYYAHRGLHKEGLPENSLGAFAAAKDAGYGIELDIHLMKDGNLAVIHDASLKRTAGVDVQIENLAAVDLANYRLEGTEEKIPLFCEVLKLIDGKVPLIVELKSVDNNYAELCAATCEILKDYQGLYCIESFDPRCILWLRKNKNSIIRGQLAFDTFSDKFDVPWVLKFALKHNLLNIVTRPDFIAYCFSDRKTLGNFLCRKVWRMQGVAWTIRTEADFEASVKEGWLPIFENFLP